MGVHVILDIVATFSRVFGDQAPALCARLRDRTVAVEAQLSDLTPGVRELVTRSEDGSGDDTESLVSRISRKGGWRSCGGSPTAARC